MFIWTFINRPIISAVKNVFIAGGLSVTKLVLKIFANIAAFYCAVHFFPNIQVDRAETYLWAGLILGLINLIVRPLLLLLTLPVNLITFGLFTLLINTWMVMLTDALLPGLKIPGFWIAFVTALIISGCNMIITALAEDKK